MRFAGCPIVFDRCAILACLVFVAILAPYHDLVPFWDSRNTPTASSRGRRRLRSSEAQLPRAPNDALHDCSSGLQTVDPEARRAPRSERPARLPRPLLVPPDRAAPDPGQKRDSSPLPGLATLAFALHPVFLAGAAFLNPDYGVAVFFLARLPSCSKAGSPAPSWPARSRSGRSNRGSWSTSSWRPSSCSAASSRPTAPGTLSLPPGGV